MDAMYLPLFDAAVAAGVTERTIRRWITAGYIPSQYDAATGTRLVDGVKAVDLAAFCELAGKQRVTAELVLAWRGW